MKCQKTIDARSYSRQALEEIRISVVHRVVAGESPDAVVAVLGMNHCTLTERRARYASTTKTTQHRGDILLHPYLCVCKSMRHYLRMA